MAIMFKIIQMWVEACVGTRHKRICLLQLKWKLLNFIEGVTTQEKITSENVLFCFIQVDSCPFPYSLSIGWSKLYIV